MVVPAAIRDALERHAQAERPNEACGLVVLRDGVAERYVEGRNAAASPYRFELEVDPETWFLEDEGYELAVFHSHLSAPPRPSRTDVENVGLWAGRAVPHLHGADGRACRVADRGGADRSPFSLANSLIRITSWAQAAQPPRDHTERDRAWILTVVPSSADQRLPRCAQSPHAVTIAVWMRA